MNHCLTITVLTIIYYTNLFTFRAIKRRKFDDELVESALPSKLIHVERKRRGKRNPPQQTLPHTKWCAKDDLKLILAVQQCSDLTLVHKCVKFSNKVTYPEVPFQFKLIKGGATACTTDFWQNGDGQSQKNLICHDFSKF